MGHDGIECTAPLSIGPLPISPGNVVATDPGPQCSVASGNIGANTISRVALGGQFGNNISLVVVHKINMVWCPPKLQVITLSLKGAQCIPCTLRQGTEALASLGRLKGGLRVRNENDAAEVAKGMGLFTAQMDSHQFSLSTGMKTHKMDAEGMPTRARATKEDGRSATHGAIH